MLKFRKVIFIVFVFTIFSLNTLAALNCEFEVQNYMQELLSLDADDNCAIMSEYCLNLPSLKESAYEVNVYEVFFEFNLAGYPSDDLYQVVTDKECSSITHRKIR